MLKLVAVAAVSALLATSTMAQEATGPSYDCATASSDAEKAICEAPSLGWYDRQLAKTWTIVLKAVGEDGAPELKAAQAVFLKSRDACVKADDAFACLVDAYTHRIRELTDAVDGMRLDIGVYAGETGSVDLVRYPDRSAALSISTVGGGDHSCGFETDTATIDARGVIGWSQKPDPGYADACTITATLTGNDLVIKAEGDACTWYCGARAELGGTFTRKP